MSISQSIIGKAIAIILVVFGHLGFVPNGGALGVSMFLVISGYGMAKSAEKNGYKLRGYWKKRIISVYIPFLVCSFFIVFLLYLTKCPILNNHYSVVFGMLGFPNNPYDPTMWFISFIFLMYLAFWCSFKFFKTKKHRALMCTMLCLIFGMGSVFIYADSIGVYLYLCSFPIGVIVAIYDNIIIFLCKMIDSYKIIVFTSIIIFLEYMSYKSLIFYILLTVYVSVFTVPILTRFRRLGKGVFLIVGNSSFAIYLLEGIMMKTMWEYIGRDRVFWNFLCGIVIISIGIVVHYILKTVSTYIRNKLIGYSGKDNKKL